ncbi:hypothetical protein SAMN05216410_0705 [Sanguibacter gelidistatuariae]|uniref:Protein kinase domain-containing protein n=1 Tax=Sanguibacter gelidistatuariae TaxID=1814289 RepID=A0A1G6H488_9MICO|nr:protein kinase family protein [Sanguibacter gelidistatuariae]SDB88964.1 hypothetical protein SAMN05216410_0705 [Sanguibacter gelidistatuariae]
MDSLEPGMLVVARYRLEEPLATDLLGVQPWAATDQILDRPVRVSLIEGPDAGLTLDAARRAALISDTHLTRVLDVLHDTGRDFVVTEPYSGVSLADLVDRGPLSARAARAVIGDAAKALEAARRRGVHHGALRPAAIRIHRGTVRVTGLGIDGTLPHSRTPATGDVASRDDAVGLVALLHYALTGVLPLAGSAAAALDPRSLSPAHQGPDDVLAPPREVVPSVPKDLDTLCVVTLGPHDDGPHTPGELVKELEPWDEEDLPADDDEPADPAPVDEPASSTGVNRQSVRVFGSAAAPSAGATMPGTPPPAGPVRRQSTGRIPRVAATGSIPAAAGAAALGAGLSAAADDTVVAVASGTAAVGAASGSVASGGAALPPSVTPQAAGRPPQPPFGAFSSAGGPPVPPAPSTPRPAAAPGAPISTTERARRFRFNPTPVVLTLMLALLVVGGVVAKNTLFSGYTPAIVQPDGRPTADSTDGTTDPTDGATPTAEAPAAVVPVIASGAQISLPGNAPDDHPELAAKAVDGDAQTAWYSRTYKTPQFGGYTHGVGFLVTLEQAAPVSSIFLSTNNTGGNVEIRATDASDPTGGTLLASGPLQPEAAFSFAAPVETSTIVIWFTELPQVSSGENRANIFEINVS